MVSEPALPFSKAFSWVAENEGHGKRQEEGQGNVGLQRGCKNGEEEVTAWVGWGGRGVSGRYKRAFPAATDLSWLPGSPEF